MHADWSVELGREDEALELPWPSVDEDAPRYYDLKRNPELLLNVTEAYKPVEMGEFLTAANSSASIFESVKCDVWFTEELSEEEEIFGTACKAAAYVDLIYSDEPARFDQEAHELLAQRMCHLLSLVPEISASVEFALRRCYYHHDNDVAKDSDPGFYFTLFVSGDKIAMFTGDYHGIFDDSPFQDGREPYFSSGVQQRRIRPAGYA